MEPRTTRTHKRPSSLHSNILSPYNTLDTCILASATLCMALGVLVTFIVATSPIDPLPLVLPKFTPGTWSAKEYTPNKRLECVEKLGEGLVMGPEDVVVGTDGSLLASTRDGWVKKVWGNGSVEDWQWVGGYPCGLVLGIHGEVLVCDPMQGLLNVTDNGASLVTNQADGIKFNFADSVTVSKSGQIYLTDASDAYSPHHWHLDVLEARPHGRVLHYDPTTGRTTVLMKNLGFANGIALSADEDFLVVCESWRYRCVRYWLEGDLKGVTETFIDNLPGLPDNIHLHSPSRTFWLGAVGGRSWLVDMTHKTPFLKHIFARIWRHVKPFDFKRADLIAVDEEGQIVASYQDPMGSRLSFATGAVLKDNALYIGSLTENFIGRIDMDLQECSLPQHIGLYTRQADIGSH